MDIANDTLWAQLSGCTLLITGATGMLGSHFALAANAANEAYGYGINLLLMCRNKKAAEKLYAGTKHTLMVHDLAAPLKIDRPVDYILHMASPVGPAIFKKYPAEVLAVNTTGTLSLLENAARLGCKGFVFASTHEVYGQASGEQTENMPSSAVNPMDTRACYVLGKQCAENALACYAKHYGLRACSARLSRLYGPNMNLNSGLFICDFIKDVLSGRPITVTGGLNLLRPLCYTQDAARAMLTILIKGEAGEAYNVQGRELTTIGDIADALAQISGCAVSSAMPQTKGLAPVGHWLNTDKLASLGFQQQVSLQEGLKRTLAYYAKA